MRSILFLVFVALVGCDGGTRLRSGDEVWVELRAPKPQLEGFAEATVVEVRGRMVLVRVDSLQVNGAFQAARGLVVGQTAFIDADRLSPAAAGRAAFEERRAVSDGLLTFLKSPGEYSAESASLLRDLAERHEMKQALLTLDVLDVAGELLAELEKGRLFLPGSLVRVRKTYANLRHVLLAYPGAYEVARQSAPVTQEDEGGAVLARMIVHASHAAAQELQQDNPMAAAVNIAAIDAEDRAFHTFLSDKGRLPIEGQGLDVLVKKRAAERRDLLALSIGGNLVAGIDAKEFDSIEQARRHISTVAVEAADAAAKLGRAIPPTEVEQRFLNSVQHSITHRARLRKLEPNLADLCRGYYESESEWAGRSRMVDVVRSRVILNDPEQATAHVEYRWLFPNGQTGIDRRTFTLRLVDGERWVVTNMGGHMSARF